MEMLDGSWRLIRKWEAGGMEEDGCCCGGEAGLHDHNTLIQLLRQREARLQRVARLLAAAFLLLLSVALALLVTAVLLAGGHQSPGGKPTMQPSSYSSEQQQNTIFENPGAMLTAPINRSTTGKYLEWESTIGEAFCLGGFNYSGGKLVVPRHGMYRVFLQITYMSEEGHMSQCHGDQLKLTNTVHLIRDTYKGSTRLLTSVDTVSCGLETWSKSLYTSGKFQLDANSRLSVTSSHPRLIAKNEHEVFFGVDFLY